jgi:hypothetical protein
MPPPANESATPALVSVLRDQLVLIGLLVSFVGLVYTDAYYNDFGVKYQLLSLPWYHIVYAGLTAVAQLPWLILMYAFLAIVLQIDAFALTSQGIVLRLRRIFLVLIVPFILVLTYVLARDAGHSRYALDTNPRTSTLPKVVKLSVERVAAFGPTDELRVLLVDSDHIVVFQPQGGAGAVPNMKRFLKGDVHEFETTR